MIVRRNGQQVAAQYVGLDGLTGLSLLQVEGENLPPLREVKEETLAVGQRVRLLAPQRAELLKGQPVPGALYLRVGEIESRLSEIRRVSSGRISRLVVRAPRLSQAFVGGVALNDAGETIGIVEASNANEARIMPTAMVRRAAERILARRASVPRPLLGISGFAVNALTQSQIAAMGWTDVKAAGLLERAQGIMLTRVLPGTPAALAELRPGDVVVRVNEIDVKSTDDLSYLLSETVAGASLNFTLLRPAELNPQSVNVTLKDYSALVAREMAGTPAPSHLLVDPLMTLGAETLSLSPRAAARFGAQGGRLVVFVNPESAAAHSGLRAGDVIEALDDQMLTGGNFTFSFKFSETFSLGIVRNRQRLKITIRTK
jgi:serine protease Do